MISLICTMDRNNLIGVDGKFPWHEPEDMRLFKEITDGKPIIFGRKTYEKLPKSLFVGRGIIVLSGLGDFLFRTQPNKEIFIGGGSEVYKLLAPAVDKMYLTVINSFHKNDGEAVYFPWPAFYGTHWQCTNQFPLGNNFHYQYSKVINNATKKEN